MGQGMVAQSWNDPTLWYETYLAKKSYILEAIKDLKSLEKYVRASTPEVYGNTVKKAFSKTVNKPQRKTKISTESSAQDMFKDLFGEA